MNTHVMSLPVATSDPLEEFTEIAGSKTSTNSDPYGGHKEQTGLIKPGSLKCYSNENPAFFPMGTTVDKLEAGVYSIEQHPNRGAYFQKKDIMLDELLILPDMSCDRVLEGIKHFWNREHLFREYKFLWKRGVLLWGPPGSGKTSLIQLLCREIVTRDGLAIFVTNPHAAAKALEMLRHIEPNRSIVVILEDIDSIVKDYGESQLLALLDGEVQIDNVVYIATTNYPETLDKRLVNRPSRFDEVIKIDMPSDDARSMYLTTKVARLLDDQDELAKWIRMTKNMSVAHLRELIVSVECLGKDFDETIKRLTIMNKVKASSETSAKTTVGFTADLD